MAGTYTFVAGQTLPSPMEPIAPSVKYTGRIAYITQMNGVTTYVIIDDQGNYYFQPTTPVLGV